MDELRVRVYGVRFGDAILISVPDRTSRGRPITRHILVDVGNVRSGPGGSDEVFRPVIEDVLRELDGDPLDLYVMTHEHLDHVQGLWYAAAELGLRVQARYAWLPASAAEDYYERYPRAKEKHLVYDAVRRVLAATPGGTTPWIDALMVNNDRLETEPCVAHLRHVAPARHTTYVYRGCSLRGRHPFRDARFSIWAPEEDAAEYYGRFQPLALGAAPGAGEGQPRPLIRPEPPPGVDTGAFYNLLAARAGSAVENLLAIDAAGNNSSVVFCLEWQGWRLLFPGDAEQRSWKTMHKHGRLQPVHFFKVSHHGSATGLPSGEILEGILPARPPDDRPRRAVVSTYPDTYQGVPDRALLRAALQPRCAMYYVDEGQVADGEYLDLFFPATPATRQPATIPGGETMSDDLRTLPLEDFARLGVERGGLSLDDIAARLSPAAAQALRHIAAGAPPPAPDEGVTALEPGGGATRAVVPAIDLGTIPWREPQQAACPGCGAPNPAGSATCATCGRGLVTIDGLVDEGRLQREEGDELRDVLADFQRSYPAGTRYSIFGGPPRER